MQCVAGQWLRTRVTKADFDVVIIGAGAAGLAALRQLTRAGLKTLCLEARDRIGGRIFTVHDPLSPIPIELGAEFVHGRSPEIWQIIQSADLAGYDCFERAIHVKDGKPQTRENAWLLMGQVLQDMRKAAEHGPDQTFADFLASTSHSEEAKQLATGYVEGFNASRREVIGIASLTEDAKAAQSIEGDSSFRIFNGYEAVLKHLARGLENLSNVLRLNAICERIQWQPSFATVHFRSGLTAHSETVTSRRIISTVSLGVLQARAIHFDPEPVDILNAADKLRFGHVKRVVCRFREPFWEGNRELGDFGFLLSQEQFFPTWWTTLPIRAPLLTGWSAGPHADALKGFSREEIITCAIRDLSKILNVKLKEICGLLEAANFHDWSSDPFVRGAYSYVPANALWAREILARPVSNTLFFSGEASELQGHSATVHGAIASGKRAAQQIIALE